jgi:prolyl oligopeptidase
MPWPEYTIRADNGGRGNRIVERASCGIMPLPFQEDIFPMRHSTLRAGAIAVLLFSALLPGVWAGNSKPEKLPKPPETAKVNVTETLHGVTITDPYRWLEDQNSPETRQWIDEQNAYTHSIIDKYPGRDELKREISALLRIDTISPPTHRGGRYFFSRRKADQNLNVLYVRENGKDEVLVDPNPLTPDGSISASTMGVSDDGKLMAYGMRKGGADEVQITLLDVDTRKPLADTFPSARYGAFHFTPEDKGFYYSKYLNKVGPRVYYHAIGSDPKSDGELFGSQYGPGEIIGTDLSTDGRYLIYTVSHGSAAEQTEIYIQDVKEHGPVTPIVNDVKAEFRPELAGDKVFISTNWDAPNGKIFVTDLESPGRSNWKLVIPESEYPITGVAAIGGKLFVTYLQDVVTHIKVFEPNGKLDREVKLPGIGTAGVGGRWEDDEAFLRFTSYSSPATIYSYSVNSGKQSIWAKIRVPVPTDEIETRQVFFHSKDKTRIPMFLVYKKGTRLDGVRPTLLTGYGGFRISETPGFSAMAVLWALKGGVWAVPNLRGGGEYGEKWHKAGMLANKQNVFDDFEGAAEWLIANKYTSPKHLAIEGASNGGLLVGAAFTQRPDLFRAVICGYPLLDMLRYQNFLVARFWVPEYGSSEDAEQFKWLRAYSPYQNVKPGTKYPAIMFVSGDSDTRVAPLHARKMAALVRADTASDYPVLLHYDTRAGHSGGGAVLKQIDDLTDEYSFVFYQLGVSTTQDPAK